MLEVAYDYLAVGIDPALTTICVQSALPALAELTMLYMNFVTVARLERNPTIKMEIQLHGFERDVPVGFLCYPVAQADDITAFKATLVPVGEDQATLVEKTNEIVRRLDRQIGHHFLPEAHAMIPTVGRLPGIDGETKMSKSQGNAIPLSASPDEIRNAIRQMYTDRHNVRAADPETVEGNVVFTYLDVFSDDPGTIEELKTQYRQGGLGDMAVKRQLEEPLQSLLSPDPGASRSIRRSCTCYGYAAKRNGRRKRDNGSTLQELRDGLGLFNFA